MQVPPAIANYQIVVWQPKTNINLIVNLTTITPAVANNVIVEFGCSSITVC